MSKFILLILMLICCTANAAMFSCVDENGAKILKNYPCEKNEKQQVIENEVEPSYSVVNSTGAKQHYNTTQVEQPVKVKARASAAPQSIEELARAFADSLAAGQPHEIWATAYHNAMRDFTRAHAVGIDMQGMIQLEKRAREFADSLAAGQPPEIWGTAYHNAMGDFTREYAAEHGIDTRGIDQEDKLNDIQNQIQGLGAKVNNLNQP